MQGWPAALAVYAAATVYFTWPLARVAGSEVFCPEFGWMTTLYQADLLLIMWIQRWVPHALATNPLGLFDANALHPVPNVLARSELLFGSLPIFVPLDWLTGNAVLALNGCILTSFVLCGLFTHLLLRRWTGSTAVAYLGGLAFAFAPWRVPEGLGRPHLLQAQYLPLVVLGLERTAATGRVGLALLTAALIALQALCSSYLAYQVFILAGAYVVADLVVRGVRGRSRALWALALAVLPALAVGVVVSIPYERARAAGQLPLPRLPIGGILPDIVSQWVGLGTAVLALGALPLLVRARRDRALAVRLVTLLLAGTGAWLIARGVSPLLGRFDVYGWLRVSVPGMTHIRAPQRFGILASFAASGLAALALAGLLATLPPRWRVSRVAAVALALVAVLFPITQNVRPVSLAVPTGTDIPPVYGWLAEHGERGPLLELPMQTHTATVRAAAFVQYYSTYHWLPVLNGHTGYTPRQYPLITSLADQLPSGPALQLLVDCTGVRWILDRGMTPERARAWQNLPVRVRPFGRATPGGQDWLLEVRMPPRGPCAQNFLRAGVTLQGHPAVVPAKLEGHLQVDGLVPRTGPFHESSVLITIENTGTERWPCTSIPPDPRVSFGLELRDESGRALVEAELVVPHDLAPNEPIQLPLVTPYPNRPGAYVLRIAPLIGGKRARKADPRLTWEVRIVVTSPERTARRSGGEPAARHRHEVADGDLQERAVHAGRAAARAARSTLEHQPAPAATLVPATESPRLAGREVPAPPADDIEDARTPPAEHVDTGTREIVPGERRVRHPTAVEDQVRSEQLLPAEPEYPACRVSVRAAALKSSAAA